MRIDKCDSAESFRHERDAWRRVALAVMLDADAMRALEELGIDPTSGDYIDGPPN